MTGQEPERKKLFQIAGLALANLLAAMGLSIMTVGLPAIAQDFSATVPEVQWVVLSYLLSVTVSTVTAGRMGDWFGHRPVLLAGLILFLSASVAGYFAETLPVLFAARAMQGVGAAIMMVLPMSLVRDIVPDARTGTAMGLLGTTSAIGTALGPSLGGLVIAWSGWHGMFALLGLLALANLALVRLALPARSSGSSPRPKLDIRGTLALTGSLLAYALAVSDGGSLLAPKSLALLAVSVGGLILFFMIEALATAPLVHVPTLRTGIIRTSLIANLLVSAGMMATLTVGPFYLTFVLSLTPASVGLVMAAGPAFAAASGLIAGRLTDRFGTAACLTAGLRLVAAGFVGLALLPGLLQVTGYVLALAILTPGYQLFLAANNTGTMRASPNDARGMVAGLLGLSRNLGLLTGASAMAALFAASIGGGDIARAPAGDIHQGFVTTFLSAAGLIAVAMLVRAIGARPGGKQ